VRSAFSHYLAPSLVEELANNHERLKLGGEMRDVTVLFADVRGFSQISEGLDAEALIRFVNEIFSRSRKLFWPSGARSINSWAMP